MMWHVLDAGSVWVKEFASALGREVPVTAWAPEMRPAGLLERWERAESLADPPLTLRRFPLQRAYHRAPVSWLAQLGPRLSARLLRHTADANSAVLVVTTPYYAPVAEHWPGPVIYYQTDKTVAYAGVDPAQVRALDRRLCRVAALVCPNSRRVAGYMTEEAGCDPQRIVIVPNATRASNVFAELPAGTAPAPDDMADLPRPVLGVIGNLAANMDWEFLEGAVAATPTASWVLVGPTTMDVPDPAQRAARERLQRHGGHVRFTGSKPYHALRDYARAFDAAVLPYRRQEPTFSGSSTRFYEHLAACRPMLATRGFEELLHKEPLLTLVDTPAELAAAAARLESVRFRDGHERARWLASRSGTWETRAATMVRALAERQGTKATAALAGSAR